MSGVKGRSGRKTNAERLSIRYLIDSVATPEDWRAMFQKAVDLAKGGDVQALHFLTSYRFGAPQKELPQDTPEVSVGFYLPYLPRPKPSSPDPEATIIEHALPPGVPDRQARRLRLSLTMTLDAPPRPAD